MSKSKKVTNQLQIYQDQMQDNTVEELVRKSIGRKRTGAVRLQYIHSEDEINRGIKSLASVISYRFYREMECLDHTKEDRPLIDDLVGADLPWTGLVKAIDTQLDERYRIEGFVRTLIEEDGLVFMLRDLNDGSPYSDGLTIFDIIVDELGEVAVNTRTGLKQMEVVTRFQGYYEALNSIVLKLGKIGYTKRKDSVNLMDLYHDGEVVSTIDITLVGATTREEDVCSH